MKCTVIGSGKLPDEDRPVFNAGDPATSGPIGAASTTDQAAFLLHADAEDRGWVNPLVEELTFHSDVQGGVFIGKVRGTGQVYLDRAARYRAKRLIRTHSKWNPGPTGSGVK
jgi:hypothetical protein